MGRVKVWMAVVIGAGVKDDVLVGSVAVVRVVGVAQPCTPQEGDLEASGGVALSSVPPPI
jgi:hypothetical protein